MSCFACIEGHMLLGIYLALQAARQIGLQNFTLILASLTAECKSKIKFHSFNKYKTKKNTPGRVGGERNSAKTKGRTENKSQQFSESWFKNNPHRHGHEFVGIDFLLSLTQKKVLEPKIKWNMTHKRYGPYLGSAPAYKHNLFVFE
jgi:hypothetical protein